MLESLGHSVKIDQSLRRIGVAKVLEPTGKMGGRGEEGERVMKGRERITKTKRHIRQRTKDTRPGQRDREKNNC